MLLPYKVGVLFAAKVGNNIFRPKKTTRNFIKIHFLGTFTCSFESFCLIKGKRWLFLWMCSQPETLIRDDNDMTAV